MDGYLCLECFFNQLRIDDIFRQPDAGLWILEIFFNSCLLIIWKILKVTNWFFPFLLRLSRWLMFLRDWIRSQMKLVWHKVYWTILKYPYECFEVITFLDLVLWLESLSLHEKLFPCKDDLYINILNNSIYSCIIILIILIILVILFWKDLAFL